MLTKIAGCLGILLATALPTAPAQAAPQSHTCMQTVTLRYDDTRYQSSGPAPQPDGPCELALSPTPASNYRVQLLSLGANPKEYKQIKKLKAEQRLQLLANQLSGSNSASPVQEVEAAGRFSIGFSVSPGPGGALTAHYIATADLGRALLFLVLEHRADRVPGAAPLDRAAARQELLSLLAGVQIAAPTKGKK